MIHNFFDHTLTNEESFKKIQLSFNSLAEKGVIIETL